MPKRGCIITFSGIEFDLANPHPDMISLDDIAHHLSMVCRWAGATRHFFSVAQHCVLVSKIVPPELQRWALMHDAAEAYIGDVTRPLKAMLPNVRALEQNIMHVIAEAFHLPWPEPIILQQYDDQIQKLESVRYVNHDGVLHDRNGNVCDLADLGPDQQIPPIYLEPWEPREAEIAFHSRYRKVFLDDDGF